MGVRIVIAGESQCDIFAEVCLVADYLSQNLPNFCWERIEIPVLQWEPWLLRINQKSKWHHVGSPIIWKEMLMKGSKPFYIGGVPEFLEYCHSYYDIDVFLSPEKLEGLTENFMQFMKKITRENRALKDHETKLEVVEEPARNNFVICISGTDNPLAMHLISGLLDMTVGEKTISKIYLNANECSEDFMEFVERQCSFVDTNYSGKVVKYVEKIGTALTHSDLLIILDHAPFDVKMPLGDWLCANKEIMTNLSVVINASASRKMCILFPNIGPACHNATILSELVNISKNNIVVATSDLGLEISATVAEIAEIPLRNMFCPPVWGFVGINQLTDVRTTVHRYDSFEPYKRYLKVSESTLTIGCLTPEFRTMEYLMYFDEALWIKIAENKSKCLNNQGFNKALAVLNLVKLWLFDRDPNHIVSLGIQCNGTFGLNFKGVFSQPSRFHNGEWVPAGDFPLPRDPQMTLNYLQKMAELTMNLKKGELPNIVPRYSCVCKTKYYKKAVWF